MIRDGKVFQLRQPQHSPLQSCLSSFDIHLFNFFFSPFFFFAVSLLKINFRIKTFRLRDQNLEEERRRPSLTNAQGLARRKSRKLERHSIFLIPMDLVIKASKKKNSKKQNNNFHPPPFFLFFSFALFQFKPQELSIQRSSRQRCSRQASRRRIRRSTR